MFVSHTILVVFSNEIKSLQYHVVINVAFLSSSCQYINFFCLVYQLHTAPKCIEIEGDLLLPSLHLYSLKYETICFHFAE